MYSQLFPVSLICIELCVFTWSQNEKGIIIISVLGTCHSSTRRRRACTHPHTCRHAEHGTALTDVKPKRAHVGQWGKQCCSLLRKEWPSAATQTQGSKTSLPSDVLPMDQRVNPSNKMNSLYLVFSIQHDGVWKVDEALEFCKARILLRVVTWQRIYHVPLRRVCHSNNFPQKSTYLCSV